MTTDSPPVIYSVRLTRSAAQQIRRADEWWLRERSAAKFSLRTEVTRVIELLRRFPELGAPARDAELAGIRRVYLDSIEYFIYYRVHASALELQILAFWSANRGSVPRI